MQKTQAKAAATNGQDAIELLTEDHKKVKKLFQSYKKLMEAEDNDEAREELVAEICAELTVHAQVEEEILYPAVRDVIDEDDMMDEAEVEHASCKDLIAQLEGMSAGDDHYDAKVIVLGEYIDHHVKEEQEEMFPKAKKSKVDMGKLGAQIARRKEELRVA